MRKIALIALVVAVLFATAAHAHVSSLLKQFASPNLLTDLAKLKSADDRIDVIVELKNQVDAMRLKSDVEARVMTTSGKLSTAAMSDFVARSLVHELRMTADMSQKNMLSFLNTQTSVLSGEESVKSLWIVNAIVINKAPVSLLHELASRFGNDIKRIEVNARVTLPTPQEKPATANSAVRFGNDMVEVNLQLIQATDMWQLGYEGEGFTLSMVDTGVDAITHPALKDTYRGKDGNHNYNWWDPYYKSKQPRDSDRHGTHCTGSMVGADESRGTRHVYGVAPKANYIACMGLDRGSGTLDALLSCWQFTMAPTDLNGQNPDPSKRAHVSSNSWGANGYSSAFDIFKTGADSLRAAGVFVSVAAGNSGQAGCRTVGSPAVFENVFAVCAVDKFQGNVTYFSSRGPTPAVLGTYNKPDACAPGQDIVSSVPGGGYSSLSGTSMATPHVSAAVALLWEAVPELNRDVARTEQLFKMSAENKLNSQCNPPQPVPNYVYGYGNVKILDAFKAAKHLKL